MNKLSYNEILDTIVKSFQFSSISNFAKDCDRKETYDHLGTVNPIKISPERDGDDDNWYRIVHFEDHNVYIKFAGWSDSYEGIQIDEWYQVEPYTETVINYKKSK